MKTKMLIIAVFLCFLFQGSVIYAQDSGYKVRKQDKAQTEIEVFSDCNIVVADIAPNNIPIYGDPNYGGDKENNFKSKQVTPNIPSTQGKGIEITRENQKVIVKIKYQKFSDTEIKLYFAEYRDSIKALPDGPGFFPGQTFSILLKKASGIGGNNSYEDSANGDKTVDGEDTTLIKKVEILYDNLQQIENKVSKETTILSLGALIWALICTCVLFAINRKALKALAREFSDLSRDIENLKVKKNSQVTPQQNMSLKKQTTMSDEDIRKYIDEQVKNVVSKTKEIPETIHQPIRKSQYIANEPQESDTDNVKYNQADNSFSIEQTDIHIFRIYSQNGVYYYTIVDDSAVREELIGMLQMFEGCITYQTTNGVAKRVEPVTDGILRKEGNKFYVDNNNKLVVQFI